ncbi:MAG: cation-translocating P-type ATPase [Tissierellia bacterium]|nr:cation-translocating P-type ATPase [Tissierellia bacterium]
MNWYMDTKESIVTQLHTDSKNGLSSEEAKLRLEKYGENKLEEKGKKPFIEKLVEQLLDPMVIILIIAAALSAFTGDWVEMLIIMAVVVLNATMSLIQEGKAEDSVEALQKMSSPDAKVIRNGKLITVKSTELVPGDLVMLETGDIVPADIRLIESVNLKVDESSLTGESVPVEKDASVVFDGPTEIGDRTNYIHSSSIVTYGRCQGIVTSTGHDTEIGKIATNIQNAEQESTPLQVKLAKLSKVLGIIVIGVSIVVFLVGFFIREDMDFIDSLMTAVSLAVAAIPEGLAAVVTIVLSIGMNSMAKRNAIVKKLLAVETLGTTTVICSDKTGTLTQNEMTVKKLYVNSKVVDVEGVGYKPVGDFTIDGNVIDASKDEDIRFLVSGASLNSDAKLKDEDGDGELDIVGDPTEGALVTVAEKAGFASDSLNADFPRVKEIPFDSDRKMMTTFHKNYLPDKIIAFTKGAPDVILDRCSHIFLDGKILELDSEKRDIIKSQNSDFARQALRVLAVAFKQYDQVPESSDPEVIEKDLVLIGLCGMIDPARPEVRDAIKETKTAGIKTIMITGDHLDTALAIAKDLGIAEREDQAMMGKELNSKTPEEIREIVKTKRVFARVSPENKVQLVTALKANGEITAMTGDGVNDAPAIKKADIGIAMGITGTDVAKNTAEVILTDDNFATIVNAVEEGRIIYSNIKKFVSFLLSCNIGEVIVMLVAMIIGLPVPLTVVQLLYLNLVTDSFPALALGLEKGEPDIMQEKPRDPDEGIIDPEMRNTIILQSVAIAISTLAAFYVGLRMFGYYTAVGDAKEIALNGARTMSFTTLVFAELLRSFSARSSHLTVAKLGLFTNQSLVKSFIIASIMMLIVIYVPFLEPLFDTAAMLANHWIIIIPLAFLPFIANEVHKMIKYK